MEWWVKDISCQVNSISNDDDVSYIKYLNYLINATSDSKQFCLSRSNVNNIIDSSDYNAVTRANMQYWSGNIILDNSIENNKDCHRI